MLPMTCQKQVLQNQNTTETNFLTITIRLALGSSSSDCDSLEFPELICCFLPAHCLHVSFMTTSRCLMFGLLQLGWIPVQLVMKTLKMSWSPPGLAILSDHICCPAPPDNWLEMRTPIHQIHNSSPLCLQYLKAHLLVWFYRWVRVIVLVSGQA